MSDSVNYSFVEDPMVTSRLHPHHLFLEKGLIKRISETLENQISRNIKHFKAQAKPEEDENEEDAIDQPSENVMRANDVDDPTTIKRKRGRKSTSKLCGEIIVSLQLPKIEILDNIDFNNVSSITTTGEKRSYTKFSVQERLLDWKIEQMQRNNGSSKFYIYHHSGEIFRSKPEVVQFVLKETLAPKPSTSTKKSDNATKKTNPRTRAREVIRQNVVQVVLSGQVNDDDAPANQDPSLGTNESTTETP